MLLLENSTSWSVHYAAQDEKQKWQKWEAFAHILSDLFHLVFFYNFRNTLKIKCVRSSPFFTVFLTGKMWGALFDVLVGNVFFLKETEASCQTVTNLTVTTGVKSFCIIGIIGSQISRTNWFCWSCQMPLLFRRLTMLSHTVSNWPHSSFSLVRVLCFHDRILGCAPVAVFRSLVFSYRIDNWMYTESSTNGFTRLHCSTEKKWRHLRISMPQRSENVAAGLSKAEVTKHPRYLDL